MPISPHSHRSYIRTVIYLLSIIWFFPPSLAQIKLDTIYQQAWAGNSINTVIFRKNSITSSGQYQYIAFYDTLAYMVIGVRNLKEQTLTLKKTNYKGNILDAHCAINIQVDGRGYLHVAWDHHNHPLNYFRSIAPGSLEFEPKQNMIGKDESKVSYPEFYKLPNGNLIFLYRDGASGNGNLIMNEYDITTANWRRIQDNLISGEGLRNAYWQTCVDNQGHIHISWVWRETPNVASNHDLCYAMSKDQGKSWQRSDGTLYQLPITAASAEYIQRIPQQSELINQTAMTCDDQGRPFIASYWKDQQSGIPQYHIVYHTGKKWKSESLNFRSSQFSLNGMGTKSIPISRPQVIVWNSSQSAQVGLIFRDEERGNKASIASKSVSSGLPWKIIDLNSNSLDRWEPTFDPDLWRSEKVLHLFIQEVSQVDSEGSKSGQSKPVCILEWKPN